ncbi:MAG: GDP-L-fucose synthase [Gammaproteobacteria bacterium]|nr:GDP-L-fucose synthase [Gammaproteobacteria bacterium]MDH5799293.1 GDP-L-fucose synthase [Gammaproteobacteria bacterium]
MNKNSKIFVAGHKGLVGSAIIRQLQQQGFEQIITADRSQLDLTQQQAVNDFFASNKPDYVFLAAAKVGGIHANDTYPADFIRDNLAMQSNIIDSAYRHGCSKLLFLGSSCIYPKLCPQPMQEDYLLTGPLEPTNEWYAIAKIAGIKMCQAYHKQYGFKAISLMPTNLYGPGDNFHLENSHVLPALIRKFHEAKLNQAPSVPVWGSGKPKREFLHVDDLANASVFLMQNYDEPGIINVGTGKDISIGEVAQWVGKIVGFEGTIEYDASKPDGTPRKLLDVSKLNNLGWQASIDLEQGLESTYQWFLEHQESFRN